MVILIIHSEFLETTTILTLILTLTRLHSVFRTTLLLLSTFLMEEFHITTTQCKHLDQTRESTTAVHPLRTPTVFTTRLPQTPRHSDIPRTTTTAEEETKKNSTAGGSPTISTKKSLLKVTEQRNNNASNNLVTKEMNGFKMLSLNLAAVF